MAANNNSLHVDQVYPASYDFADVEKVARLLCELETMAYWHRCR